MEYDWTYYFLILFVYVGYCRCQVQCENNTDCTCYSSHNIEMQCPENTFNAAGLVIHIGEDRNVIIDCYTSPRLLDALNSLEISKISYLTLAENKTAALNISLLPNLMLKNVSGLEFYSCPLPEENFKRIFDKLGAENVGTLKYDIKRFSGEVNLNEDFLEGLQMLRGLELNNIGLVDLDEDVFVNTRNLLSVKLQGNNVKLKSKVFQPTVLLKTIDLSENNLENLPGGLFRNLQNLQALYLRDNNLKEIDDSVFNDLLNLKSLDLRSNELINISENAFRNLNKLVRVDLSVNKLTKSNFSLNLPDYLFSNLTMLQTVDISNCKLRYLPEHIFLDSSYIEVLNLTQNLLENFSEILLSGLENLKELFLGYNKIKDITPLLKFLRNLEKLDLSYNEITTIEGNAFDNLRNLKEMYLQGNQISEIHFNAFNKDNLNSLKIIDLSNNKISKPHGSNVYVTTALFQNVLYAEEINLSNNFITNLEDVVYLVNKLFLKKLDLSRNNLKNIAITDSMLNSKNKFEIILDSNQIISVDFQIYNELETQNDHHHFAPAIISLNNNVLECTCQNYDLFRFFQTALSIKTRPFLKIITDQTCFDPLENKHVLIKNISLSSILCSTDQIAPDYDGCPQMCGCYWRPHDTSFIVDCSSKNFTALPNITFPEIPFNQTELNFNNNSLSEGPNPNMTEYNNATRMWLSNNKIKNITWLPPKLQILKLHNNSLSKIDYNVLKMLSTSNFMNLTLENNPWICDCRAENLTNFLRQKRYVDGRYVFCVNTTTSLVNLSGKDLCFGGLTVLSFVLPVMCVLLASATLVALYYRYQMEIKMWLFIKNFCLWWVTEEDLDKDKTYDAFISFSHKDDYFVIKHLLPVLEGKEGYKLCVHYRNWVPGEFISKQVTNSVCESRRTIIVLSANFLESVWGKLEFRTAHTQAMSEGRARVIVILYGEIDVDSLDNELKLYLKSNTYVKWGDPYFWNKLKYALPHSRKKILKDGKYENIVQLGQISPPKNNTLTLDFSGLKNSPNEINGTKSDDTPTEVGALLTPV